jgi:hypothetical protein
MPVAQTLWLPSLGFDASGLGTPVDDRAPKLIPAGLGCRGAVMSPRPEATDLVDLTYGQPAHAVGA